MRTLMTVMFITLPFCLLTDRVPFVGAAAAQTQTKPQMQSREALYVKCRMPSSGNTGSLACNTITAHDTWCCHTPLTAGLISVSPAAATPTEAPARTLE